MPQQFQVLRCCACAVFQVHQVKKSIKWECKMCGAKQSLKRNYGTGSGKDCRLHVQKLNELRFRLGEAVDRNDITNCAQPQVHSGVENNTSSKWSQFVDTVKEIEPTIENETENLFNGSLIVLDLPQKKRKKHSEKYVLKSNSNTNFISDNKDFHDETISVTKRDSYNFSELEIPNAKTSSVAFIGDKGNNSECVTGSVVIGKSLLREEAQSSDIHKNKVKKEYLPPNVSKNSKWAQYVDDAEPGEHNEESDMEEILEINDHEKKIEICSEALVKAQFFSECNDNEIYDFLDF